MLKRGCQLVRKIGTGNGNSFLSKTIDSAFGKYLVATNTVSSGILMLMADVIEQEFHHDFKEPGFKRYDYMRLGRMFIVGLTMGPVHHYYYGFVHKLWPTRDMVAVSKKIIADQFIMSPICIGQFFYTLGILQMKPLKETNEEIVKKFVTVYTMDWCVWPPTQFINFYLVPSKFQVMYINFVTMLYDVFLSYIKYEY